LWARPLADRSEIPKVLNSTEYAPAKHEQLRS